MEKVVAKFKPTHLEVVTCRLLQCYCRRLNSTHYISAFALICISLSDGDKLKRKLWRWMSSIFFKNLKWNKLYYALCILKPTIMDPESSIWVGLRRICRKNHEVGQFDLDWFFIFNILQTKLVPKLLGLSLAIQVIINKTKLIII